MAPEQEGVEQETTGTKETPTGPNKKMVPFPQNERTAQWHFQKFKDKYYPAVDNQTQIILRNVFKAGFQLGQQHKEKH